MTLGKETRAESLVAENLDSASLHLLRVDLLGRLGRTAEVREALEVAYKFASNNLEVLRRVAACRDVYGDRAATVYEELARKLESENGSRAELIEVLERGLIVAMRDGDIEAAQRISISLRSYSTDPGPPSPSSGNPPSPALVKILGGTKALARMAGCMNP